MDVCRSAARGANATPVAAVESIALITSLDDFVIETGRVAAVRVALKAASLSSSIHAYPLLMPPSTTNREPAAS